MREDRLNPGPGPLVLKVGGRLLDDPLAFAATFAAIATLHRELPGGAVLVHGGGVAVDRQLERLGLASEKRDGIRITPSEHVEQIAAVLAGLVNKRLVGLLASLGADSGCAPVGICLGDGWLCETRKATRFAFDPGRVGEVTGGDGSLVRTLLEGGFLPVVSSIGLDAAGELLNVNADDAAAALCPVVGASGLVLLTDVPGVRGQDGATLASLDRAGVDALVADGTISGGMIPKVRSALEAAAVARVPVTIAGWNDPESLLRLARGDTGGGTGGGTRFLPEAALTT
jgi:acetylglutamate kinase